MKQHGLRAVSFRREYDVLTDNHPSLTGRSACVLAWAHENATPNLKPDPAADAVRADHQRRSGRHIAHEQTLVGVLMPLKRRIQASPP